MDPDIEFFLIWWEFTPDLLGCRSFCEACIAGLMREVAP